MFGVYAFILCLCFPVFRQWPCDVLITRPRSPIVCEKCPEWTRRATVKETSRFYDNLIKGALFRLSAVFMLVSGSA
jgi:hypothetical protein